MSVNPDLIVERPDISLLDSASRWYGEIRKKKGRNWLGGLESIAEHYGIDLELTWQELPQSFRDILLYGSGYTSFQPGHLRQIIR